MEDWSYKMCLPSTNKEFTYLYIYLLTRLLIIKQFVYRQTTPLSENMWDSAVLPAMVLPLLEELLVG